MIIRKNFTSRSNISRHFYENNTPKRFRFRSRRSQMFFKTDALKYFAKLAGKQLCWSLFLIKLQAFKPGTLLKRDFIGNLYGDFNTGNIYLQEHLFCTKHLR